MSYITLTISFVSFLYNINKNDKILGGISGVFFGIFIIFMIATTATFLTEEIEKKI